MRSYFTSKEEKVFARLVEMQACVAEQELHPSPCTLLAGQLNELQVFAEKLLDHVRAMRDTVKDE